MKHKMFRDQRGWGFRKLGNWKAGRLEGEGTQKNKSWELWGQAVGESGIWGQRAKVMGSQHEVMIKWLVGTGVSVIFLNCYCQV